MIIVIGLAIISALVLAAVLVEPTDGDLERRLPHDPVSDLPIWALLGRH